MPDLRQALFEPHWALIIGLVIVSLPLAWLAWTRRRGMAVALAPLVLAAGLVGADLLVQTDREKVGALIGQVVRDARANDAPGVGAGFADRFTVAVIGQPQWTGRQAAVNILASVLKAYPLSSLTVRQLEITVLSDRTATATLSLRATGGGRAGPGRVVLTAWRLDVEKQADGQWLLTTADLRELNDRSAAGLHITPDPRGWFDF